MCYRHLKLMQKFTKRVMHKVNLNMEHAYFRQLPDSEQFQFKFYYNNPELNVNREFNFCRKLAETASSFLSRINSNVEKVIDKKNKKKAKTDPDSLPVVSASFHINGMPVDWSASCRRVFKPEYEIVLRLLDNEYSVVMNSPWVDALELPKSLLATFVTYPSKFETVYTDRNLSVYYWYSSKDKVDWALVGTDFLYSPSNEDVGLFLKFVCIPKNEQLSGPRFEVESSVSVEASPGTCPFELRQQFTKERTKENEFRVVTYNILADLYCDSDYTREVLHPYCPPYALAIDYRKQLILKELIGYNADLICLQEVDQKVFLYDLEPIFSHLGYNCDFSLKGGTVAEGQACFYSKNKFRKIDSHRVILAEILSTEPTFQDIYEKIQTNATLSNRFLERTSTLQVNVIESVEKENEILCVANTHLYFHPDSDHIRLIQGGVAIKYLEHLVKDIKAKMPNKRISLIFCGDFNSVPECGIYKLYTTGTIPAGFVDFKSNSEEAIHNLGFEQSFLMESACGTPKYTNFTSGFADCLDYIYYEKDNLEVTQVVPLPSDEELQQHTALPSIVFPSDHIALISDLKWR